MRMITFSVRNIKEILRDPLNLIFGLGFPLVLLVLLSVIQANIPVSMFELEALTPGITVFGLAFTSLFGATLVAKDRESAFLQRLYTTPLTSSDFILGYALPLVPIALAQSIICYIAAFAIGLEFSFNNFVALLFIVPVSLFYISLGLLCGSILNVKQIGGICGGLLTNLSAWLSGIWFDLDLVGGTFKKISYALPFVHAVELEKAAVAGDFENILPHFFVVLAYTIVVVLLAVLLFLRQMKKN